MSVYRIEFIPTQTQYRFITDRREAVLFCGAMRAGKTMGLVWSAYFYTKLNPSAPVLVLRDTWTNLQRSTLKTFFATFPPGVVGTWRAESREFSWSLEGMEGTVTFMGLDDSKDVSKLQSVEAGLILIDEAGPGIDSGGIPEDVFDFAMGRLSAPKMHWHQCKLAENPPDEDHWTYRRFVDPGEPGWGYYITDGRENEKNLPKGYYEALERRFRHRPDLLRRLAHGKFGFTQVGDAVTPEWSDEVHLAHTLHPDPKLDYWIGIDFGLNPTAVICQITPMGRLHVLWCVVGEGVGIQEYIDETLRAALAQRFDYKKHWIVWVGDPAGTIREQSSSKISAVRTLLRELGGEWRPGPKGVYERVEPLRAALRQHGKILVDKQNAKPVWHALRGGWHRHTHNGVPGGIVKDIHSHPGDALAYLVARVFPLDRVSRFPGRDIVVPAAQIVTRPRIPVPKEARVLF